MEVSARNRKHGFGSVDEPKPLDDMTVAELKDYIEVNNLDVNVNQIKSNLLAGIKAELDG